jgi:S-disulfanyl-L-cysteine oxidoreductase SoxD
MFKLRNFALIATTFALLTAGQTAIGQSPKQTTKQVPRPWHDIGRVATPNEVKAWDIDVRPDFKGLPPGSGSVTKGEAVWEAQCVSCHGTFGESNEVFTPIVGGTGKDDLKTGMVANLRRADYPQRSSLMKLSSVSTLWDYINRAMPWNAPKSLTVEEVYAVTAYILHLGDVLPANFVLSDSNIAQVQAVLPNRNGVTTKHGLWSVGAKPDVQGSQCMKDCKPYQVKSTLPEYAQDAHGNLAEQNRLIGPVRGMAYGKTDAKSTLGLAPSSADKGQGEELAKFANCFACHAADAKLLGPSFKEVAKKYRGDAKAPELLAARVRNGAQGVWGAIPMPGNPQLKDDSLMQIIAWILAM